MNNKTVVCIGLLSDIENFQLLNIQYFEFISHFLTFSGELPEYATKLQRVCTKLTEQMNAVSVAREMFQRKALTKRELETVTQNISSPSEAVDKLIKILLNVSSHDVYASFETALLTTRQQHIIQLIECQGT